MKFSRLLLLCMALLSGLWLGTAQALPTVDEVQAAAQRGDFVGAQKMVREVLAAKPDSARAHYVLAELLAHERQFNEASEHVHRARALDPAIKFTDAAKFSAFEQLLQREQAAQAAPAVVPAPATLGNAAPPPRAAPAERSSGGVPVWLLVGGAVVFIVLAMRWMGRRAAAAVPQPAMAATGYGTGPTYGYGPGMPQAPVSGGPGLMGVGLAAAGGVAAGMLAEKLLHGDHDEHRQPRDGDGGLSAGIMPGSFGGDAGSAADELSHRSIDFGSGDGWDGGGGSGSGAGGGGDW